MVYLILGFHAIAYSDGSFVILDMRGPKVLYLDESNDGKKSKRASTPDFIRVLRWTLLEVRPGAFSFYSPG